jgi:hypothetical protein
LCDVLTGLAQWLAEQGLAEATPGDLAWAGRTIGTPAHNPKRSGINHLLYLKADRPAH